MSEASTGTSPFAASLRPTEEVLWVSAPPRPLVVQLLRDNVFSLVGALIGLILGLVVITSNSRMGVGRLLEESGGVLVGMVAATGLIGAARWLWTRSRKPTYVYAVTNERLLSLTNGRVSATPLESLEAVTVLAPSRGRGALSFGAFLPTWSEVDTPAEVKAIIDDARARRLKELGQ